MLKRVHSPAPTDGHEVLARSIEAIRHAVGRGGEVDEFAAKARPLVRFQRSPRHVKRSIALRHELDPLAGVWPAEMRIAALEGECEAAASQELLDVLLAAPMATRGSSFGERR